MTDDDAFLRAIQAAPNDAAPKLVYADWLDENGQPLRAEYLRLMVELTTPDQVEKAATQQRRHWSELRPLVGSTWIELLGGIPKIGWNAETLLLLGHLQGVVQACASFKSNGYLDYQYYVRLLHKFGKVEEVISHTLSGPIITLRPLENEGPSVRATLLHWLTNAPTVDEANRRIHGVSITEVLQLVRGLLSLTRTWEVVGGDWPGSVDYACLAFESEERVLVMSFEVSD